MADDSAKPLTDPQSYERPTRECDVVMKGGITSGVVYPHAICRLAQSFRLRSIGGTSAGAIAAGCAAAAELGRNTAGAGFARLATLPDRLGAEDAGKRPVLLRLFQPAASTRRLFRLVLDIPRRVAPQGSAQPKGLQRSLRRTLLTVRGIWLLVRHGGWLTLGGVAACAAAEAWAIIVLVGSDMSALATTVLVTMATLLLASVSVAIALYAHYRTLTRAVPRNLFGICTGSGGDGQALPLTDWLHEEIQALAGLPASEPVTFGHLARSGVDLQMVTTCLTHGRPYGLPCFPRRLYFDPSEFGKLFRPEVVDHLERHGKMIVEAEREIPKRALEHRFMSPRLPLPEPKDIPILVAVRMSLAFPLLLSAVPLWDYDWGGDGVTDAPMRRQRREWLRWAEANPQQWRGVVGGAKPPTGTPAELVPECVWFADGGISSNFPIHLFDAPVPTRPTVGIDLRYHAKGRDLDDQPQRRVQLAQTHSDRIDEDWTRIPDPKADGALLGFVSRVLGTMQNWNDGMLTKLPGVRDRFASVHLQANEGGANLSMGPEEISFLRDCGAHAGELLRDRFSKTDGNGSELTWTNHRWTRLRASLGALESWLAAFVRGLTNNDTPTFEDLVRRERGAHPTSYNLSQHQVELVTSALQSLRDLHERAEKLEEGFRGRHPKPLPVLRSMPVLGQPSPHEVVSGYEDGLCEPEDPSST